MKLFLQALQRSEDPAYKFNSIGCRHSVSLRQQTIEHRSDRGNFRTGRLHCPKRASLSSTTSKVHQLSSRGDGNQILRYRFLHRNIPWPRIGIANTRTIYVT